MSSKTIYSSNNLDIIEAGIYDDTIIYNDSIHKILKTSNLIIGFLITSIFLIFIFLIYNFIKVLTY